MSAVGAVIYDCDGVLVDSEPISNRLLAEALTEIGLPTTTKESVRDFMGRSMADGLALIEARLGRPVPEDFVARYDARTEAAFARELRPVPGVIEALGAISLPDCVASSGAHPKMRFSLAKVGLLARFEGRLFSATDVARGKPHPDLFLHAARRMGFDPASTAVVEDSPAGVSAARAAGMVALGYAGRTEEGELAAAGARTFADMAELPALVGRAAS